MNHLAHCFLSFGDEDLLLGNFIGDFVKGNDWQQYPAAVQQGILLHRTIDSYTDNHPMTDRSVARIRPYAGRYSPPFTDILYDHLLALNWEKYTDEPFDDFAEKTYRQLENRRAEMPPVLQERLPKMTAGIRRRSSARPGMRGVGTHAHGRVRRCNACAAHQSVRPGVS